MKTDTLQQQARSRTLVNVTFPRTLVVTSCTGEKHSKVDNSLTIDDFETRSTLAKRESELAPYALPAGEMYSGAQHVQLYAGVKHVRNALGVSILDVWIVSAGYGLIPESRTIAPYEVTFNAMGRREALFWSRRLRIREDFQRLVQDYDLIFLLLGEKYLRTLELPVETSSDQSIVIFAGRIALASLARMRARTAGIPLGPTEAKQHRYGLVGLKGSLMRRVLENVATDPQLLTQVHQNPAITKRILTGVHEGSTAQPLFPALFANRVAHRSSEDDGEDDNEVTEPLLFVPDIPAAPNVHLGMQYYIPDVDDRVDPGFDFLLEKHTSNRDPHKDDWYAHEFFAPPNYDGVLISKVAVESSKVKRARILAMGGVHDYIRYRGPIMGDCGAFGYISKDVPPFETRDILEYYHEFGFNYGVSIDHLIVGPFSERGVRDKRFEITLRNADDFLRLHSAESKYNFEPIGVIQGWDPESYGAMAQLILDMGYTYVAIGGLARSSTRTILDVLTAIQPYLRTNTRLHLFGVARLNAIEAFRHLGVTSFDSASPLRRAWLGVEANYHTLSGKMYAAIRVPPIPKHGAQARQVIDHGASNLDRLERLESGALRALRAFDLGALSLDSTLDQVLEYDDLADLPRNGAGDAAARDRRRSKHGRLYREVLEDTPWRSCPCTICQTHGIETVIFRGNNRNRRRGFHNTFVFFERLQRLLRPKIP